MRTSTANFGSVLRLVSHFFLAAAPLILVLSGCSIASSAFAQSLQPLPDVTCRVPPLKAFWGYNRIDKKRQEELRSLRDNLCALVRDHKLTLARALEFLTPFVTRTARCRDDEVRPWVTSAFTEIFGGNKMPDNVALMFRTYCEDTYDPNGRILHTHARTVIKKEHWLDVELFCQTRKAVVFSHPWLSAISADVPSEKRLKEQTDMLCDEVRSGKLTVAEGTYRWQQEVLRFEHQFTPEETAKAAKSLEAPLKALGHLWEKLVVPK